MEIDALLNLGVAGAAIAVMFLMFKISSQRFAEKDRHHAEQLDREIAKRDIVEKEIRDSILGQLSENTRTLQEVVRFLNNK